ncbi:MAG: hypothetical protein B1H13_02220 [Desulfobacteraceae bacterium 4484_190.3]|nr:MAG: hypothetical protein B1H13_02220 [Desulfobacteraceae bacterium 4484_190.3]
MSEKENIQTGRIKLLIVDDEIEYVNVLSNRLKKRNVDVTKAFSGSEGIRALRGQNFDVAVLDLKMQDIDGIEVLKIFKKMDPQLENQRISALFSICTRYYCSAFTQAGRNKIQDNRR